MPSICNKKHNWKTDGQRVNPNPLKRVGKLAQLNEEDGERKTNLEAYYCHHCIRSSQKTNKLGKVNLFALKALCFQSSSQLGAVSPLISCHYHPINSSILIRPILFPVFCDWLISTLVRMKEPPFFASSADPCPSSFKSLIKFPSFRRCDKKSMIPGDEELGFNPGSATHWLCEFEQVN